MEELVTILEILAVTLAVLTTGIFGIIFLKMIANLLSPLRLGALIHSAPKIVKKDKPKKTKKTRRTERMSKDTASEGDTINDIFMFMIAVPLVLLWVGFAGFVIHSGFKMTLFLNKSKVIQP